MKLDRGYVANMLLGILALVACGFFLKTAQGILLPLVIAWLLSYIVGPVQLTLTRRHVPAGLATAFIVVLLLAVCYLLILFFHARVTAFAAAYPRYQEKLNAILTAVTARWQYGWNPLTSVEWSEKVQRFLLDLSGSLFSFVSSLVMVLIFLVFILQGKPFFEAKVCHAFPGAAAERVNAVLGRITREIGRYLVVQFIISLVTGALVWFSLSLIGVDFAVTWGAVAFLLNFIPTLGSIVASVPPVLLAWVQFHPNPWPAITVAVALLAIQTTLGNVISPKVMGDRLNLSPVCVLLSLVFWGWLWGPVGAILSVPIASAIKVLCENVDPLRPIAVLMSSGRVYARAGAGAAEAPAAPREGTHEGV